MRCRWRCNISDSEGDKCIEEQHSGSLGEKTPRPPSAEQGAVCVRPGEEEGDRERDRGRGGRIPWNPAPSIRETGSAGFPTGPASKQARWESRQVSRPHVPRGDDPRERRRRPPCPSSPRNHIPKRLRLLRRGKKRKRKRGCIINSFRKAGWQALPRMAFTTGVRVCLERPTFRPDPQQQALSPLDG